MEVGLCLCKITKSRKLPNLFAPSSAKKVPPLPEGLVAKRKGVSYLVYWRRDGRPSSFFTKRLLDEAGGFDEALHYVMDTDLWHKFYFQCGAKYRRTRHNIFAYRQHEASKMSGADEHATERALVNRQRAKMESEVLSQRYGRRGGLSYKLAHLLSLSLVDHVVAWWRNLNWRGRYATEI